MQIPRVRFTLRRLMIAVAVVSVGIWAERVGRQRQEYIARARQSGVGERYFAGLANTLYYGVRTTVGSIVGVLPDGSRVHIFGTGPGRHVFFKKGAGPPLMVGGADADEATVEGMVANCRSESLRLGRKRLKYERATRYPWLLMPPDPPEPR